jgi:F-type H+-transporting ATPase subunit a
MAPEAIFQNVPALSWFTNSLLVSLLVGLVLTLVIRLTTANLAVVPNGKQNFVESIVEALYGMVESMVGRHLAPRVFALLGSIFVFLLVANYSGLFPGVGTLGFGDSKTGNPLDVAVHHPVIRPPSADLNMNLAIAAFFMVMWLVWSIQETGVKGFFLHIFGPKGKLEGNIFLKAFLIFIFAFVGLIEVISIAARPVSLSLRLYGNIFAGENLLHNMSDLGKSFGLTGIPEFLTKVFLPLPFYFLELLVGLLQAGVFMILCTVYILLSTTHDEEHDDHHGEEGHH